MKKYLILFSLFISFCFSAQEKSDYKYAIVPSSFNFLKEPNQYNLNELSKFLTAKKGLITFFDSENKSAEFNIATSCEILKLNVTKESAFLATKLKITVTDCNGNIITESIGTSREKDFKTAYNYALREAFELLQIPIRLKKTEEAYNNDTDVLYVQKTPQGYKLYDSQNILKYTIYTTSRNDIFVISDNEINGVLYKNGNSWTIEYLKNEKIITETGLKIKF